MSYEIFYDKRFIKLEDDMVIPIMQHGSNNCWDISGSGRDIPEKSWSVVNYPFNDKYIFTKEEIALMGKENSKCDMFKARGNPMTNDEVERFYINGYRAAKTLEFYLELGNHFEFRDITDWDNIIRYNPKTTEELKELIEERSSEGKRLNMGFTNRNFIVPKRNKIIREKRKIVQDSYYVLGGNYRYFKSLRKYGYSYVHSEDDARVFISL